MLVSCRNLPGLALPLLAAVTLTTCSNWPTPPDEAPDPPQPRPIDITYRSPEASLATMRLPPGYKMELVAAEPMIQEPCLCVWDGNGRMYVAELRTYMQDADGTGTFEPTSRVVRLEDTDNDGRMDTRVVFADGLLLPRVLLTLGKKVIIGETNTLDLYCYEDTDGDGKADTKELWLAGGPRGGNLEHQPSGLIWALDNWIYRTYGTDRIRLRNGKVIQESCPGGGQWGLTQTDEGKVIYVDAGGESGPFQFNTHTLYGKHGGKMASGYRIVWPRDNIPDVQGGPRRLRSDNTLNHFTATCGQSVYRARRLPDDFYGNLVFCEPVGRLVRRSHMREVDGETVLSNAYEKDEFITSTDANFRPINSAVGPDGGLYIVDMYRGIIQEGNWVREGSYLRKVVDELGLAKNVMRGRIWRVVHEDHPRGTNRPRMLDQDPADLIPHLSHPNGWWRDTAQKLIVLSGNASVVPALKQLALRGAVPRGRMHALWTLEGLGVIDRALLIEKLHDTDVIVRRAALRISEGLLLAGDADLRSNVLALQTEKDPHLLKQLILTISRALEKDIHTVLPAIERRHEDLAGIVRLSERLRKQYDRKLAAIARKKALAEEAQRNLVSFEHGKNLYETLCISCHGKDGQGLVAGGVKLAPDFQRSVRLAHLDTQALIQSVLHGVTGPLSGQTYVGVMVPMKSYDDAQIAGVLNYIRNSFGNKQPEYIQPDLVARVRSATADRTTPYTETELRRGLPQYQRILKSIPDAAPGRRDPGKRLLVFSDNRGHKAPVADGILAVAAMAEKTGAFTPVFSNDLDDLRADRLKGFAAVFINNASAIEKAIPTTAAREELVAFVAAGGGLAGIHAAADGGWPEYTAMLGARADRHPWRARGNWGITIEDPEHPLMTSFDRPEFRLKDELYRFKDFDRARLRVLMSIDVGVSPKGANERRDKDHALAWVRAHGKGRVFYSALGHNGPMFRNPAVLGHWLAGIQFALGNLDAPTASLPQPEREEQR